LLKLIAAIVASLGLLSFTPVATAVTGTGLDWPAIHCGNPCVISDDGGGIIDTNEAQGRLKAAGHVPVIVDGPCLSACTRFVDIDRANVCLTERALLGYHQWRKNNDDGTFDKGDMVYDTPGLNAYIKARGGEPTPDSGHLLMLTYLEANQFYKLCPGAN
jgi:hypothetical protein